MGLETIAGQFPSGSVQTNGLNVGANVGTLANDTGIGTTPWTIGGATLAHVNCAAGVASQGLQNTNFGFAIPSNAHIVNLTAQILGTMTVGFNQGSVVVASISGLGSSGLNQSIGVSPYAPSFALNIASANVGGLTPTLINSSALGIELQVMTSFAGNQSVTTNINNAIFTVTYTVPGLSGVVFTDTSASWGTTTWSNGGQNIRALTAQPSLVQPWQITGYSIGFQGVICTPDAGFPSFGRFGEIWGGLLFGSAPTPAGSSPWQNPMSQFPADSELVTKLWDGTSDTTFPFYDLTQTPAPSSRFLTFPQSLSSPVALQSGEQISVGLWITPSLVQNAQLVLMNATYSVTYSTGQSDGS